jgi:hypothetical protein
MALRENHYIYERVVRVLEELEDKFKDVYLNAYLDAEERLEALEAEAEVLRKLIKMTERLLDMMKSGLDEDMYSSVVAYNAIYGYWIWLNQLLSEIEMMIEELRLELEDVSGML